MMKKTISIMVAAAAVAAAAGQTPLYFCSEGPDMYADGTVVRDGEIYALVWSRTNEDGSLASPFVIDANGRVADDNHRIVACAAIAKDGGCPPNVYLLGNDDAGLATNGVFSVYLLDTRAKSVDGGDTTVGFWNEDGTFVCNSYELVPAKVELGGKGVPARGKTGVQNVGAVTGADAVASAVPAGVRMPSIIGFDVDGDIAHVEVGDAETYLRYSLEGYRTLDGKPENLANGVNGGADGKLSLDGDAASYRFFKVVRSDIHVKEGGQVR